MKTDFCEFLLLSTELGAACDNCCSSSCDNWHACLVCVCCCCCCLSPHEISLMLTKRVLVIAKGHEQWPSVTGMIPPGGFTRVLHGRRPRERGLHWAPEGADARAGLSTWWRVGEVELCTTQSCGGKCHVMSRCDFCFETHHDPTRNFSGFAEKFCPADSGGVTVGLEEMHKLEPGLLFLFLC